MTAEPVETLVERVRSCMATLQPSRELWAGATAALTELAERLEVAERERDECVRAAQADYAELRGHKVELAARVAALEEALREFHENMWTVSNDDGPEFVSSEGLKYMRSWFDRTSHLLPGAALRVEGYAADRRDHVVISPARYEFQTDTGVGRVEGDEG